MFSTEKGEGKMVTKFYNFNLIDGTGADVAVNSELYVQDGKIVAPCEFEKEVDLGGQYVIPGLMDTHVHVSMPPFDITKINVADFGASEHTMNAIINLDLLLSQGVTYIRDVGSIYQYECVELPLRKYLANGTIKGPNMKCSGPMMQITGGHMAHASDYVCDGVDECRKMTRKIIAKGVDLIKFAGTGGVGTEGNDPNAYQFNIDEVEAIVCEAHKVGKKVATHAHGTQGIKNAVLAGVDSIEHGTLADDETLDLMAERGTWLIPTLGIQFMILSDPRVPAYLKTKESEISAKHKEGLKKAYEKGVKIACGTDLMPTLMPFAPHLEIQLIMEATGMSALEGIKVATKNSAELIGIDNERGTLEVGKIADFVVIKGNPCDDIKNIKNVISVYQNGVAVK